MIKNLDNSTFFKYKSLVSHSLTSFSCGCLVSRQFKITPFDPPPKIVDYACLNAVSIQSPYFLTNAAANTVFRAFSVHCVTDGTLTESSTAY